MSEASYGYSPKSYSSICVIMEGDVYKGENNYLSSRSSLKMICALGIRQYGQFFFSLATLFVSAGAVRNMHLITLNSLCFNK